MAAEAWARNVPTIASTTPVTTAASTSTALCEGRVARPICGGEYRRAEHNAFADCHDVTSLVVRMRKRQFGKLYAKTAPQWRDKCAHVHHATSLAGRSI
jgi:hypothetical protein